MNVTAIIQARMTSSRLPGKVLKRILEKPLLEFMIERVRRSWNISNIVIATTVNSEDDPVAELAVKHSLKLFRGSENNVLERFYQAADSFGEEVIMRLTGDCPLIDPDLLDDLVEFFNQGKYDYACNCLKPTLPDGLDAEIFTFKSLQKAYEGAQLPSELEHVTLYIRNRSDLFTIGSWEYPEDFSRLRWTVDELEDFYLIEQIISKLYPQNPEFGFQDILRFLQAHPELESVNTKYMRNEGLEKSLREDRKSDPT